MIDSFRSLTPAARLLVINQLGINLGFYMVLPFLATYLLNDLGFAAALVGLVLGLRVLSQQGLFLVGGTAADRLGARPVIIAGCAMRVLAFGLLAATAHVAGVLSAIILIGVAGAFFNPAVRTYVVHESPGRRAETFAMFEAAGNVGAFTGPLLGAVLLGVDFRLVSLVACLVFASLTIAQVYKLPKQVVSPPEASVLSSWRTALTNRRFFVFALAGSAFFALFNQLYFTLPVELERVTGRPAATFAIFLVFSTVGIFGQVPVTAWCRRRWTAGRSMATGLALMGLSFLPLAVAAPLTPTASATTPLPGVLVAATAVLLGTLVLSVGITMVTPFAMELMPIVGSERLIGTYYGWYYLVSAVATIPLSTAVGALLDLDGAAWPTVPFLLLAAVGLAGGTAVAALQRRGTLDPLDSAGAGSQA